MADKTPVLVGDGVYCWLDIPEGAVVTGVVVAATYQRIDEEMDAINGTVWAHSNIPLVHAVGMGRALSLALEKHLIEGGGI